MWFVESARFGDVVLVEAGRHADVESEYAAQDRREGWDAVGRDHSWEVEVLAHVGPAVVDGESMARLVGVVVAAGMPGAGVEDQGVAGAGVDGFGVAVELRL